MLKQRKHVSRNAVSRMKPYKLVGFQTKLASALTNAQQNLLSFQLWVWWSTSLKLWMVKTFILKLHSSPGSIIIYCAVCIVFPTQSLWLIYLTRNLANLWLISATSLLTVMLLLCPHHVHEIVHIIHVIENESVLVSEVDFQSRLHSLIWVENVTVDNEGL